MSARTAVIAVLATLAAAAPASAAYAPQVSVQLDPPAPATAAAMTLTVTQAGDESATRTSRVGFPRDFLFNPGFAATGCASADEQRGTCPDSSRIGSARADTAFGPFQGPIFYSDDFRLLVVLRGVGGTVEQKLVGIFIVRPDGGYDGVFDNLPDVLSTRTELRIEGGARGISLTPRACGAYTLPGRFTSHKGEQASSDARVEISGCPARVSGVRASPRALGPGSGVLALRWRLSQPAARTAVVIDRWSRVKRRWRRVGSLDGSGMRGANELRFDASLGGRRLSPGSYRFVLRAADAAGKLSPSRQASFRIGR